MLYARFGRGIAEKFLIPYNEKLYACDLATLDNDAMGRFFPARGPDRHRPQHEGAGQRELQRDVHVPGGRRHRVRQRDRERGPARRHRARRSARRRSISSARVASDARSARSGSSGSSRRRRSTGSLRLARRRRTTRRVFTWNKVLVFNLGFDAKGQQDVHWVYYPDREHRRFTASASTTTSSTPIA